MLSPSTAPPTPSGALDVGHQVHLSGGAQPLWWPRGSLLPPTSQRLCTWEGVIPGHPCVPRTSEGSIFLAEQRVQEKWKGNEPLRITFDQLTKCLEWCSGTKTKCCDLNLLFGTIVVRVGLFPESLCSLDVQSRNWERLRKLLRRGKTM